MARPLRVTDPEAGLLVEALSPDELAALGEELGELFDRWRARAQAEDDVERSPVFVFARGFPAQP